MKDIIPATKQSPILGLSGMGGGVGSNLGGSLAKRVYVDEVYATYSYKGDNTSNNVIINDLDLAERGGMVLQKARDFAGYWPVTDTVRGAGNMFRLNTNDTQISASSVSAFNNNGFTIGDNNARWNSDSYGYCSWSFCKQEGFFDIVQYTGNNAQGRQIEHNLGCVPSMVWVKRVSSGSEYTAVWTKESYEMNYSQNNSYLETSNIAGFQNSTSRFGAPPTATHFTVGDDNQTNSNATYIAYLFGGGSATSYDTTTNPLANSCEFNGSNRSLTTGTNVNFKASGDWTLECWFKTRSVSGARILLDLRGNSGGPAIYTNGYNIVLDHGSAAVCATTDNPIQEYQWYHVAGTRSGNTWTLYLNGKQVAQGTNSTSYSNDADFKIGRSNIGEYFNGNISNVRYTNGEVLYTSCFRPSLDPLKSGTNTKLLCCQNSTVTGATTIPSGVTITNTNGVTLSGWTPYQDKKGNIFGSDGDQNIVRSGSYLGNTDDLDVYCGFQPQLIMIKRLDGDGNWVLYDQHRNFGVWSIGGGTSSGRMQDGANLQFNNTNKETGRGSPSSTGMRIGVTPTGFQLISETQGDSNANSGKYMWFAIRDIDGKVCKPAEDGIDVFSVDTGSATSYGPNFDTRPTSTTGFIRTDMTINTYWDRTFAKRIQQRMNNKYIYGSYWNPDGTSIGAANAGGGSDNYLSGVFNFEDGSNQGGWNYQAIAWMWKKSEGFATFNYEGTGTAGLKIPHDLGGIPEMIWINNRVTGDWKPVYHHGVNGGVNPENYTLQLNTDAAAYNNLAYFHNTAPTEHDFTVGNNEAMNKINNHYSVSMWRSITGVSKVGYYTGTGSTGLQITTGFNPRFLMIKYSDGSGPWYVLDTVRGWGAGNDQYLLLNTTAAQVAYEFGAPTATGFQLDITASQVNTNGGTYLYYAHA